MNYNDITSAIIGSAIDIHRKFGPGLLESVYETLLAYELRKKRLVCVCQSPISLTHETLVIPNVFRADIIVNNSVLIELKSVDLLSKAHFKQTLTYLRLTGLRYGLLLNLNDATVKEGLHRIVNDQWTEPGASKS